MTPAAIVATALGSLLLLGRCSSSPAPGLSSQSYSNDHSTTAGGFELGPQDFNTNGGAFGPDRSGAQHARNKS